MTIINGTNGADSLTGTSGSDIISGGNGNDLLSGGAGCDLLSGGNGNDVLLGGEGADILSGDNGDDSLDGGAGSDIVTGGNGNDILTYTASENAYAADIYDGGSGRDTLRLVVSQSLYGSAAFQADLAQFQAKLDHGSASQWFQTLHLQVTSIEKIEVTVVGTNHAPTAVDDSQAAVEDTAITIPASSLLANDSDADGDAPSLMSVQGAQHGSVNFNSITGQIVFVPETNFSGPASFTYTVRDSQGSTSTATVVVNVAAVADAPDLDVVPAEGTAGEPIPLHITLALIDSSETLGTVRIENVPADSYTLSHGTQIGDGVWEVAASDLPSLALLPASGSTPASGSFDLHIVATSIDGSDRASAEATLSVSVAPAAGQQEGRLVDGYIAGATVFADTNENGVWDQGEARTTTNADGSFTLTGGSGPLVAFGGTDVSTGLTFNGVLRAPEGSTVITPLTTLVAELAAAMPNGSVEAAEDAVAAAFGFDPNIDLQTYDPVPGAVAGNDPTATAILSAAIQVQSVVAQISAVADPAADVFGAIADAIVGGAIDLSDADTIGTIATNAGVVDEVTHDAVTAVVTAAVASIQAADNVTELAQAAQVAQGATTDALAATNFNVPAQVTALTTTYVENLDDQVAAAVVGDVDGPLLGTLGNDVLIGTAAADAIDGLDGNDKLVGGAGDDLLYGGAGRDRADYADATAGITIDMAAGIVSGNASVGTDTLRSIEQVGGSDYDDVYNASNFSESSPNTSSVGNAVNTFEGRGGNDTITGNGNTQLSYLSATAGVTVDLAAGTATGDTSVGTDSFTGVNRIRGSQFNDTLLGSNAGGVEQFTGGAGNDFINGRGGNDRAVYSTFVNDTVTAGVTINLAAGTVTGDTSVGTDTLRSIEFVRGSNFADVYDSTGFTTSSTNAGNSANGNGAAFNEIEGMGGNDVITGNGNTRIAFYNAAAGVTVDILAGTASGDTSVGNDTFTNVSIVAGSQFNDTFFGSNNAPQTSEQFEGRGGDDLINGRGGFDQAIYNNDTAVTTGIHVDMAAGFVTGDAAIGADTLRQVESVRGTNFADTYIATGFGSGANVGSLGTLNEFEGLGGNDVITGSGDTRISFVSASGGVTVDLVAGTATGNASVGSDTFTGVARVRGSNFNDIILGDTGNNILEGQDGNDRLTGREGNDTLNGGNGVDIAIFSGTYAEYDVSMGSPGNATVADTVAGRDGTDTLSGVELIEFSDRYVLNSQSVPLNLTGGLGLTAGKAVFGTDSEETITSGTLANTRLFDLGGGNDTVNLNGSGTYVLNYEQVENINGTAGNEIVSLQNVASGLAVSLGTGTDSLTLANGNNDVTVSGAEAITGGTGDDRITIGITTGITTVTGGLGADVMTAGAGDDHFRVAVADSVAGAEDTIIGFDATQDAFELNLGPGGPSSISYIGSSNFSGTAGDVRLQDLGGGLAEVQIDVNGDMSTDMQITLQDHVGTLSGGNFLLI